MIENDVLNRITYFLKFKCWSLYRLAKESGIPYSSLNNIFLRGTCPTIPTLEKICQGFGISLSEFFEFQENPLHMEQLTEKEEEIIYIHRSLSVRDKALFEAYLEGLCKIEKRQKNNIPADPDSGSARINQQNNFKSEDKQKTL